MKLKNQEQLKLNSIISNYQEIYKRIESKQKEILDLESDVTDLFTTLNNIRKLEKNFGEELERTYGKGKFNIKTKEYELDK